MQNTPHAACTNTICNKISQIPAPAKIPHEGAAIKRPFEGDSKEKPVTNETSVNYVEGRSCEGCTMCCKLLKIGALDKPRLKWCPHCDIGTGCKIYDDRPFECRIFDCGYVTQAWIGEHWKPARSKMVVTRATDSNRLVVYVDPDRTNAWRKEPFYSDLKSWARGAARNQGQVLVAQGRDMIVIMPEEEINVGPVRDDQVIISRRKRGAERGTFDHLVVDQDDPVLEAINLLKDGAATKKATPAELADAKRSVDAWFARHK